MPHGCGGRDSLCLLFRNEMSKDFKINWVDVWLDHEPVFSSARDPSMAELVGAAPATLC